MIECRLEHFVSDTAKLTEPEVFGPQPEGIRVSGSGCQENFGQPRSDRKSLTTSVQYGDGRLLAACPGDGGRCLLPLHRASE
jgi:hypothetical protein